MVFTFFLLKNFQLETIYEFEAMIGQRKVIKRQEQ